MRQSSVAALPPERSTIVTEPSLNYFFPSVVQSGTIADAEALNRRLLPAVEAVRAARPGAKPDQWSCSLYTTMTDPESLALLDREPFSELKPVFLREAVRFGHALSMDVDKFPPRITDFWVNVFEPGDAQDVHRHPNSIISGIYYVQAPPESGYLMFHSPADDELMPPMRERSDLNVLTSPWEPQPGQLLLFRSWLRHSVMPNRSDALRVSLSFNVCL